VIVPTQNRAFAGMERASRRPSPGSPDQGLVTIAASGGLVALTIPGSDVHRFLLQWGLQDPCSLAWAEQGTYPTLAEVRKACDGHIVLMIWPLTGATRVGYFVAYGSDIANGTLKAAAYLVPQFRGSGLGAEALILALDLLFSRPWLRKVYFHVPEDIYTICPSRLTMKFREEGLLRQHLAGRLCYQDLHILALYREEFATLRHWYLSLATPALGSGQVDDQSRDPRRFSLRRIED
jgi:hypothetical protein